MSVNNNVPCILIHDRTYGSTGYLIKNKKSCPGLISDLREGDFETNFNITTAEFIVFL